MNSRTSSPEAIGVVVVTLIALSGWGLQRNILQSFVPGAIGMKLVTATCFLLAAVALMLIRADGSARLSNALASIILVLGLIALIEEGSQRDLGIDRMWISEVPGKPETVHPGRMAMNTALSFVALGIAMMLARSKSSLSSVIARLSLLLVGVISVQVLIGYVFSAEALRSSSTLTPMAFPTAINFALLSFGTARLRTEEWPIRLITSQTASGAAARSLIPAAALITIGTGWLRLRGQQMGLYGTATGTALYSMANVLALWGVTLYATSRLFGNELARLRDRTNLRRALAAQDLISTASREIGVVEKVIVEECCELAEADGVTLVTLERGRVWYRAAAGTAAPLAGLNLPAEQSFFGSERDRSRPESIDAVSRAQFEPQVAERLGPMSATVVPLHHGQFLGSIVLFTPAGKPIGPEKLDLLEIVASASAAALSQAWQLEHREEMLAQQSGELAILQGQFRAFMSNVPAAAFIKDSAGRYLDANPATTRFLDCEVDDILGLKDEELPPAARQRALAAMNGALSPAGETASRIVHFDDGEENSAWLVLTFPIQISEGRSLLGGVAIDVSKQRQAEEQIAQLNEMLERRVEARTLQLQRSNAELEAFTYSVSHDLRSPLRAVMGYSRILEEDYSAAFDEEGKRFLLTIRSEAQRMGNLIDDLLSFSRLGRQSLGPAEVDMTALAHEVLKEVLSQRPERQFQIACSVLPHALADRSLVRQVLVNLLSNAAKYVRDTGAIEIEISGSENDGFNTYVVRDRGVGFDMRYIDKLFGVFQRLHSAEEFEGTGVGLAIVERIVTRHGGRVWAEGVVGQGAAFYFTLPALGSKIYEESDALDFGTPHQARKSFERRAD